MVNTNIFRHLIFGDVDSADYGIYINGDAVYNAPERDAQLITIPGRNGQLILDGGRFENIEITYPCGVFAESQEAFRNLVSNFRNAILSQTGYQRLEDSYHPNEFRNAVYMAGLEMEPVKYNQAGEFELTFNCKPQRFLLSGDSPIPVDSGVNLFNPTRFNAEPLLEVEGNGSINFNGYNITINNVPMGNVDILNPTDSGMNNGNTTSDYVIDKALFNVGDTITVKPATFRFDAVYNGIISSMSVSKTAGDMTPTVETSYRGGSAVVIITFPTTTYTAPAVDSSSMHRYSGSVTLQFSDNTTVTYTINAMIVVSGARTLQGGLPEMISFTATMQVDTSHAKYLANGTQVSQAGASADSTVDVSGHPTYLDCAIGEAYKIEDGQMVSLNRWISFGSDLPVLAPDDNTVTFDNTITDLKITPRWWRI